MPLTKWNAHLIPVEKYKQRLLSYRIIEGDCWLWGGCIQQSGYGKIGVKQIGGAQRVHRLSLFLFAPERFDFNLQVNHKCSNRACFNPDHLYSGTAGENTADWTSKITHCPHGHLYDEYNTTFYGGKWNRICRECDRLRLQERRAKRNENIRTAAK